MDNEFPCQLFSCFFNDGPPANKRDGNIGGWRSYSHVIRREDNQLAQWHAQNQVKGERWLPTQQIVMPLLPPNEGRIYSSGPHTKTVPMDFHKHMQNFYQDNSTCAFQTMSHLLSEPFYPEKKLEQTNGLLRWRRTFLRELKYSVCPVSTTQRRTRSYDNVFGHAIHDIPPSLLAELLHEELLLQRQQEQFQEVSTGGALSCISLSDSNDTDDHCLIYPSGPGLQTLNFHKVELQLSRVDLPELMLRAKPIAFNLNGPIRQVSTGTLQEAVYVGARSDYFCGAWLVGDSVRPRCLEVIQTKEPATCLVVSPHVSGELLVASESGAVYLWTVGKGLSKVREEDSNLYFNANSAWRWCEFSAHPRVLVYADRTGADLTDFRAGENHSYTLFRIGKVSESKRGERVILAKYLSEIHAYHHLVTTQYSAYIMDERMPSVPMLKWDHFMESSPMFAHAVAGTSPQRSNRLLLGSQKNQELIMMQYAGGCEELCVTRGPHQKLLSPNETVAHLPIRVPHRSLAAQERLSLPAAGLTALQSSQHLCVVQLSAAGDMFYQTLRLCSEGPAEESSLPGVVSGRQGAEGEPGGRSPSPAPSDSSLEDSQPRQSGGFEVVVNDHSEHLSTTDLENGRGPQPSQSIDLSVQQHNTLSKKEFCNWREWLSKLDSIEVPKSQLRHCIKAIPDMALYVDLQNDPLGQHSSHMQHDLRNSMQRGEVVVHSATHLPLLPITPVPGVLEPSEWTDDLSQRLSEAWQGRWKQWWEDKLGLNREQKLEALRRKRRQEKSKSRRRVVLSGSFTSSISYQSDSELSGLSGFSSCASQDLGSDWDSDVVSRSGSVKYGEGSPELTLTTNVSLGEPLFQSTQASEQEASTPQLSTPVTQESVPVEPSQSPPLLPAAEPSRPTIPASTQKRPRRTEQDILESLFSSQEASQELLEERSLPVMAPSSQLSSFSSSQRPPQIRASLLQASQPKKKKPRMGF